LEWASNSSPRNGANLAIQLQGSPNRPISRNGFNSAQYRRSEQALNENG
jgi:hypothetical protein